VDSIEIRVGRNLIGMEKMYCPKCGCEYRDGFLKCSDCAAALVSKPHMRAKSESKKQLAEDADFVVVIRTGRIWEVEMIANAFKKAKIPCYQQLETSGGLRVAKEIPQSMGPGDWWAFYVPKRSQKRAEKVLAELPIEVTVNPDIWHFGPPEEGKKYFKTYATYMLLAFGISLFLFIIGLLRK
jgi:hypothetical protein